jgi:simple sugar transport system ATP-binding protein
MKLGKPVLKVNNIVAENDLGQIVLKGIDLEVFSGEIVGLAGVSGNGQRELAEVLSGLRKPSEGQIWISGQKLTGKKPAEFLQAGVSYIPGDRMKVGLIPDLPVRENLILKRYRNPSLHLGPLLDKKKTVQWSHRLIEEFGITVPDPDMPVRLLSGGNQQKVILARELSEPHHLLVVEHPTRGLDVQAAASIRQLLLNQRADGKAILVTSGDLDELIALSDRIAVIYEGQILGILQQEDANPYNLGLMMAGQPVKEEPINQ